MFEFYERVSGARMHAAYIRPGGVHQVRAAVPCLSAEPLGSGGGVWAVPVSLGGQQPLWCLPACFPGATGRAWADLPLLLHRTCPWG